MNTRGTRRLRDGREVDIGRNDGLRKVCRCGRRKWAKCPHPWHFSFQWEGEQYRFSLERHVGRKLTRADAEAEAERLRTAIRAGDFHEAQQRAHQPKPQQTAPMSFRQFADDWSARRGYQLVRPGDNDSRLKLICAMLETCCRPGEILSLQWQDVDLETRELTIRAEKAKTRRARRLPISSRLLAILEMRKLDPSGKPFPPDAYVFGNRLGRRVTSIRTAWENAREAAGLKGIQLRDLRHEAASRFEEAGVLTTDVSKFLGHRNLSTTTRYLNTTSRRLRLALLRVEQARAQSESLANSCKETPESVPQADDAEASSTPSKSLPS
jgi:integrase